MQKITKNNKGKVGGHVLATYFGGITMRKKIVSIVLCIVMTTIVLSACKDKNADKNLEEKTAEIETTTKETESHVGTHGDIKEDVIVITENNVYDGINRIAVTFHGDSTSQIGLSWYTPISEDKLFGNDIEVVDAATMQLVNISFEIDTDVAEYDEDSMYHQTVISGLKENTTYYFRVGDEATDKWSEYGSFTTSSKDIKEFTFVAVTDTQSEHLPDAYFSAATMKKALELVENSAFIMHSGDFVDEGDEEYLWLAQMNTAKDILMNNIIVPAVGNHEDDSHAFWQHFKIPHTNDHKTTGAYYSYNYGNVHFVVLDTNKENSDGTSYVDDEQLEWLKEDLQSANDNGADWIIVNMHKGLYTTGEHSDNEKFAGETGARKRVGEVFEEYGVDLVMQGHDHCPSVTYPIKDRKASDTGVIYVNTGSAGAKSYSLDKSLMPEEYYELFSYLDENDRNDDTYQNFAIIDVTSEKIVVKLYEMNMLINENNLYIIDEIEIKK